MADPSLLSAGVWALITVTNANAIHQESGFRSQAMCEDAISIARYGRTVAEEKAFEAEAAERRRIAHEKWRADHPPREPKTDAEREMVKHKGGWSGTGGCGHVADGLIYDDNCDSWGNGGWIEYSHTYYNQDYDIKFARCLPDPDAK